MNCDFQDIFAQYGDRKILVNDNQNNCIANANPYFLLRNAHVGNLRDPMGLYHDSLFRVFHTGVQKV